MRYKRCGGSGFTWMSRGPKVYAKVGEPEYHKFALCPTCGRELRVRRHMFNRLYNMLPQHKAREA